MTLYRQYGETKSEGPMGREAVLGTTHPSFVCGPRKKNNYKSYHDREHYPRYPVSDVGGWRCPQFEGDQAGNQITAEFSP